MISEEQKQKEQDFNNWLGSIEFIDEDGNWYPAVLTKDQSEDPEGDMD